VLGTGATQQYMLHLRYPGFDAHQQLWQLRRTTALSCCSTLLQPSPCEPCHSARATSPCPAHSSSPASPTPCPPTQCCSHLLLIPSDTLIATTVTCAHITTQVVSLTAGICVMTWLLCYFTLSWSASLTPVLQVNKGQLAAIASLGATLMMARSPASAVSVRGEW
jgi:hypothetical protein